MKAISVRINGQEIGVYSGGENRSLIFANLRFGPDADELEFRVNGFDDATDDHLRWTMPPISLNDEITLRVTDTNHSIPPSARARYEKLTAIQDYRQHLDTLTGFLSANERRELIKELITKLNASNDVENA